MKAAQLVAIGLLVVALVGCGSKKLTNPGLASDIQQRLGSKSTILCWTKTGSIGGGSEMGYDRVCGISTSKPSLYVRIGVKAKPGWCLVSPRLNKAPDCPY